VAEINSTSLLNLATAYYRLEDVNDSSGHGYNLTNNGTTGFAAAKYNNGADFTATNSTKSLSRADSLGMTLATTTPFSFACWINPYNHTALGIISDLGGSARNAGIQLLDTGYLNLTVYDGGLEQTACTTTVIPSGQWTHIAYTVNNAAVVVYVNGEIEKSYNTAKTGSSAGSNNMALGKNKDAATAFFCGLIDDAAFFPVALTQDQIKVLISSTVQTVTVYPTIAGYVDAGNGLNTDWATLIASAGGRNGENSDLYVEILSTATTNQWSYCIRTKLSFDTSVIGGGTINSAILSVYGSHKSDEISITPDINIYSAGGSGTVLANSDYESMGTTPFSTTITYAGFSATGWNDFVLNAAGLAAISKTGYSIFGLRHAKYDVAASAPVWSSNKTSDVTMVGRNGVNRPKLIIDYELGATSVTNKGYSFFL
jgi:hypothetical protein